MFGILPSCNCWSEKGIIFEWKEMDARGASGDARANQTTQSGLGHDITNQANGFWCD